MTEKSFRIWTAALGLGAFVVLMMIDVATEEEAIPLTELIADALQLALVVASATGVALLANSFRRDRLEKETLIKDLRMARAAGAAWRERAEGYLSGLSIEIEQQFRGALGPKTARIPGIPAQTGRAGIDHRNRVNRPGAFHATECYPDNQLSRHPHGIAYAA